MRARNLRRISCGSHQTVVVDNGIGGQHQGFTDIFSTVHISSAAAVCPYSFSFADVTYPALWTDEQQMIAADVGNNGFVVVVTVGKDITQMYGIDAEIGI